MYVDSQTKQLVTCPMVNVVCLVTLMNIIIGMSLLCSCLVDISLHQ